MGPLRSDLFYPCFSALVVSMPEVPKINFDISYGHTMDVVKKAREEGNIRSKSEVLKRIFFGLIHYCVAV